MKNVILFDLDGTLTDPQQGITRAIQHAQQKLGEQVETMEELRSFIGPPLQQSFQERGYSEDKTTAAITYFREYFAVKGMFENEVYDGIERMLQRLKEQNYVLAIATSKPEVYANDILAHFQLADYFDVIVGSELDGRRTAKAEVIEEVLVRLVVPASSCVMIGDRKHDMIGARHHQIEAIGVTYGYGSKRELLEAGASHICNTVHELNQLLEKAYVSEV
ncbi:HAD family hydrolase [Caryophanon latum]|uniref:Phosphoglycolate phosphatase n=1 Tax=Caryophanon latum TaxID=33977 RepID=A0A1C0Z2D8_9BACL|nr:HAD family hydrolase [Caryophanon latum]OCS93532.1 hypothetical protein A6K76_05170 [Caryophanon latum]